jgi:hypothetical protein
MKITKLTALLILVPAFVFALPSSQTGTAVVRWVYNYTAIPEGLTVNRFTIYYGIVGGSSSNTISVATSATSPTTNAVVSGLTRGATYYFEVAASNTSDESDPSTPAVNYTVPHKPNAPTNASVAPN